MQRGVKPAKNIKFTLKKQAHNIVKMVTGKEKKVEKIRF